MRRVAVILGTALAFCLVMGLPTAQAQQTAFVRGTLTAMAGDTITVKVGNEDMTFSVDKSTRVIAPGGATKQKKAEEKGAEGAKIGDILKVGEGVEVHYKETGTTKYATEIRGGITKTTMQQAPKGTSVRGKVTAVASDKITVNDGTKDYEFAVDSNTRPVGTGMGTKATEFKKLGKAATLPDFIGVGDTVIVNAGADMKAHEVRLVTRAKK